MACLTCLPGAVQLFREQYTRCMSIRAALSIGICIWVAIASPAFPQQQIESHSRQAQEFLRQGQPDLAVAEFRAILALDPNNLDARGNLGVVYFFQGDYAKAAPELRSVVKLRPNLWKIQALLGISEKRLGQSAGAQADLEQSFPNLQEEKVRI